MAVLNSIEYTATPEQAGCNGGALVKKQWGSYAKTAALPAANDILIMARNIPLSAVIQKISLTHAAISGFTDADIVLVDQDGTIVNDSGDAVEYLAETLSFASARADANVLTAAKKPLKTLLNKGGDAIGTVVDIAFRVVTPGTTASVTIDWDIEYTLS